MARRWLWVEAAALAVCAGLLAGALLTRDADGRAAGPATLMFRSDTDVKFRAPRDNVFYSCGSLRLPEGLWRLSYHALVYSSRPKTDTGTVDAFATLTTYPGGPYSQLPETTFESRDGGSGFRKIATANGQARPLGVGPDGVTVYLMVWQSSGGNWDSLQCLGATSPTLIVAERLDG